MKNYIFVSTPSELDYYLRIPPDKSASFLTDNILLKESRPDLDIAHLFPESTGSSSGCEALYYFAENWFRDEAGRDLLYRDGFSVGTVLIPRLMWEFADDIRYYQALSRWTQTGTVRINQHACKTVLGLAPFFGKSMVLENIPAVMREEKPPHPGGCTPFPLPNIHRLSPVARFVQKLSRPFMAGRKILYLPDWTSIRLARKRKDALVPNSYLPWKGYYYALKQECLDMAEKVLPVGINPDVRSPAHLEAVMHRFGIAWDESLFELFSRKINAQYLKFRPLYIRTYAIYLELLSRYKPRLLILPGDTLFAYLIAVQIARQLGIRTLLLLDGYELQITKPFHYSFRDHSDKEFLFDFFAAFGMAHFDLITSSGIPPERIVPMKPTIISTYEAARPSEACYDAIVMAYNLNHFNTSSPRTDYANKMVMDVIGLLMKMGMKRLAIKVKAYGSINQSVTVLSPKGKELLSRVDILTGDFGGHVRNAKCIVGQVTTAVFEAAYHGVPYYIYEPYENGKTDKIMATGKMYEPDRVARTLNALEENLRHGRCSVIKDRSYLFDGAEFSSLDLTGIFGKTSNRT